MAVLSPQDETYLRQAFETELVDDVTIALFTQPTTRLTIPGQERNTAAFESANQIMEELAALSDKIHLEVYDHRSDKAKLQEYGIQRVPAAVVGIGELRPARFFGVIAGYEFSTLIQDIIDVSKGDIALSEETQQVLRDLQADVHIQVFVTPT